MNDEKRVAFTQRERNETVSTNPTPVGKLTSIKHVCRINRKARKPLSLSL